MNETSNEGFSLAETVIATVILAIMLLAAMNLFFYNDAYSTEATHHHLALILADGEMENIVAGKCPPATSSGPLPVSIGNLSGTKAMTVTCISGGLTVSCPAGTCAGIDYKQIQEILSWTEPGKPTAENITLVSYIAP